MVKRKESHFEKVADKEIINLQGTVRITREHEKCNLACLTAATVSKHVNRRI